MTHARRRTRDESWSFAGYQRIAKYRWPILGSFRRPWKLRPIFAWRRCIRLLYVAWARRVWWPRQLELWRLACVKGTRERRFSTSLSRRKRLAELYCALGVHAWAIARKTLITRGESSKRIHHGEPRKFALKTKDLSIACFVSYWFSVRIHAGVVVPSGWRASGCHQCKKRLHNLD